MNLYRHKTNKLLYIIDNLIIDLKIANCNGNRGIYAEPYNHQGETISYVYDALDYEERENFNPLKFVSDNFDKVSEI